MTNTPPIVAVTWEDATTVDDAPWAHNEGHEYKPYMVYQVGFLLADTEQGVILSQAWSPKLVGSRDQIPRGMIRSMVYLTGKRKRKA